MGDLIYTLLILGVIALCLWIWHKIASKFKFPKIGCLTLISGGVKAGKSTFGVGLALQQYKRVHRRWKIRSYFQQLLHKKLDEEPLLYSNIPLACSYVPLTDDLLLRKMRFRYGSIIYINEASLVADSRLGMCQTLSDMTLNERLMLFNKLIGHETLGGSLIYDTQAIGDLHISVRRCLSNYIYIHHLEKHIPFMLIADVREERYSEDGSVINAYTEDVENSLRRVIMSKRVWKKFDAYCFSYLTDNLPVEDKVIEGGAKDLKAREVLSFRHFYTLPAKKENKDNKEIKNEKKDDSKHSG